MIEIIFFKLIVMIFFIYYDVFFFCAGGLKSERSSVVSSLDCLSSIVERISTDNSSLLPPADGPGSPPTTTVPVGEAGTAPATTQVSSPTASQDPSLIYQVL